MKPNPPKTEPTRLYRSESNRMIAGVAGGLGEYFDIDPTIIRIIFVILALFQGSGLFIYLGLWVILPVKSSPNAINESTVNNNIAEIKSRARSFAHSINIGKNPSNSTDSRFWWAVLIIALGFYFLFRNFGIFDALDLDKFWPLILIVLGVIFIAKR